MLHQTVNAKLIENAPTLIYKQKALQNLKLKIYDSKFSSHKCLINHEYDKITDFNIMRPITQIGYTEIRHPQKINLNIVH